LAGLKDAVAGPINESMKTAPRTLVQSSLAAALLVTALAGCGGSSSISDQDHRDFVAGCSKSAQPTMCECIFTQLTTKQGYDSETKLKALAADGDFVSIVQQDALACK
jgi:hypothetical protein